VPLDRAVAAFSKTPTRLPHGKVHSFFFCKVQKIKEQLGFRLGESLSTFSSADTLILYH